MKNRTKFAGIIALAALIGFLGVSCDTGGGSDFNAPNPSIPNLTMAALPAVPDNFFPAGDDVARFIVPTTAAQQQWVLSQLQGTAMSMYQGILFLAWNNLGGSTVGALAGGSADFSTLPAPLLDAEAQGVLPATLTGTATSNFDAIAYRTNRASSGNAAIRSPNARFDFQRPVGAIAAGPVTGNRSFGAVAASLDISVNWNPNRENMTQNWGYAAVMGFVLTAPSHLREAFGLTAAQDGFAGQIRIRAGSGERSQGGRHFHYTGHEDFRNSRNRYGQSSTLQVEFFNPTGGDQATAALVPVAAPTAPTAPVSLSTILGWLAGGGNGGNGGNGCFDCSCLPAVGCTNCGCSADCADPDCDC